MNLDDLDLKKLTKEQAQDIKDIEALQKQIEQVSSNLTVADVRAVEDQFSFRMNDGKAACSSRTQQISTLQYEIDKYQKQIELMKLKLQFKQQLTAYKSVGPCAPGIQTEYQRLSTHQNPNSIMGGAGCQSLCGLGPQKNGSLECYIF